MEYLVALVPSAGVLFLFVVAIRAMLRADRSERAAVARMERDRGADATRDGTPGGAAEGTGSEDSGPGRG